MLRDTLTAYAFAPGRKQRLAELLPADAAAKQARADTAAAALAARLKQIDTALDSYVIDLGRLSADPADPADPADRAMRDRIHTQFAHQHHEREAIEAQLKALTTSTPPRTDDTDLLDELPELSGRLDELPERIQAQIFAAFDIQVLWNAPMNQATFFGLPQGVNGQLRGETKRNVMSY